MAIPPPPGIPLDLTAAAMPSDVTNQSLRAGLEALGMDCSEITDANLTAWITEVKSQLPQTGLIQSFALTAPAGTVTAEAGVAAAQVRADSPAGSIERAVQATESAGTGNWTISDSAEGYQPNLGVIQAKDHFAWLMAHAGSNGFAGAVEHPPAAAGDYQNAAAIQSLFIQVGDAASQPLVKGLDMISISAAFANAIKGLTDAELTQKNYHNANSITIYLVDNYNTTTRAADGVGVLTVDWDLTITDWQRKEKHGGDTHPTVLVVTSRAVVYTDVNLLCTHYQSVLKQFGISPSSAPPCRTLS